MHVAKLSNLDHFGFAFYSYERLLDPLLEQRESVVLSTEEISRLANLLNSPEVINYCEVLKEQRKSMSSADFKVLLKSIIEQGQINGLTRHEVNVFYNMLLVKLSTEAIPQPILESPSLEILYDKEGSHKKELNAAVIDRFLYKPEGKQHLWGYKITSVMDPSILEAEAYMKLIKEQYGLEIKQKELHQRV